MSKLVVSLGKQGVERHGHSRSVVTHRAVNKPRAVSVATSQAVRADSRGAQEGLAWVLLLDDDPINSRGLSRWLKCNCGLETRSARTIQQAERWLASMPAPRAIISDFDLEGTDTAVTALGRFRSLGVQARALVLTGAPLRARAALLDAGWRRTPVLSKANFQTGLAQWLLDVSQNQGRTA